MFDILIVKSAVRKIKTTIIFNENRKNVKFRVTSSLRAKQVLFLAKHCFLVGLRQITRS